MSLDDVVATVQRHKGALSAGRLSVVCRQGYTHTTTQCTRRCTTLRLRRTSLVAPSAAHTRNVQSIKTHDPIVVVGLDTHPPLTAICCTENIASLRHYTYTHIVYSSEYCERITSSIMLQECRCFGFVVGCVVVACRCRTNQFDLLAGEAKYILCTARTLQWRAGVHKICRRSSGCTIQTQPGQHVCILCV